MSAGEMKKSVRLHSQGVMALSALIVYSIHNRQREMPWRGPA